MPFQVYLLIINLKLNNQLSKESNQFFFTSQLLHFFILPIECSQSLLQLPTTTISPFSQSITTLSLIIPLIFTISSTTHSLFLPLPMSNSVSIYSNIFQIQQYTISLFPIVFLNTIPKSRKLRFSSSVVLFHAFNSLG